MTQSDADIVRVVLSGQNEAFALLVRRYERSVRAVAINILGKPHLADDASQEAFFRAWQRIAQLRNPEAFGPWLMKITRRCALDLIKKSPALTYVGDLDHRARYEGNGQLDEDKQRLLTSIMRLRQSEQQVITLRYFGSHSVQEIAEISGRSVGTVTKQLSRAHRRLRKQVKRSDL
ncbi:RNA polymerase sigma factor [Planctomycetota bacterium]